MFSVLKVDCAKDLSFAKVYISVYSKDKEKSGKTFNAIKDDAKKIRYELSKSMILRTVPELSFVLDDSMEYSAHMDKIFKQIQTSEKADNTEETEGLKNFKTSKEIANKLLNEKSVAVIFHVRPDGDAIGSAVSLLLALNKLGIKAEAFCDDDIHSKFSFILPNGLVKRDLVGDYTALVAVDCADLTRLGEFADKFVSHKNTYNIDHHLSNLRYAEYNYVCDKPSNCENIYQIIKDLGVIIDSEIAKFLYMGIMTDTGGFRHKGIRGETYKIAGELVDLGADPTESYFNCFSKQTKNRAKLYSRVTSKIRYYLDGRFALTTILQSDIVETGALSSDREGIIDFIMGIEGVEVGVTILESPDKKYKVSFRGRDTDVNEIAGCFGGGGHRLASGCQIGGDLEEVIDKLH